MLNVYDRYTDLPQEIVLVDAEAAYVEQHIFEKLFTDLDFANTIIEYIDQSHFENNRDLYDRFDRKLQPSKLSTGCKCALLVAFGDHHYIVDTVECGDNAIEAILLFCTKGNIICDRIKSGFGVPYESPNKQIAVRYNDKTFMKLNELNNYITYNLD